MQDRGGAAPGDAVRLIDPRRKFVGVAHYSSTSQISLRLLNRRDEPVDAAFYRGRIASALEYRARVVSDSNAFRAVFSEADLLPGLIIDRYADAVVIQTLDQGMDRALPLIVEAVEQLMAPDTIVLRNDAAVRERESLPLEKKALKGDASAPVKVRMNGFTFHADLLRGQKTGVYLDQRDNYPAAARHARGRMLDCFTSSGGFAIHTAGSVETVTAIDSSAQAIESARANAAANGTHGIDFRQADVFEFLAAEAHGKQSYGTIVLDPPAFAKSRGAVDGAARGYKEINLRALRLLETGGTLVTCSCSHHMSEAMLLEVVAEAALDAGRVIRIIERRTQAADHPILLTVPETLYLKCLILQVLE